MPDVKSENNRLDLLQTQIQTNVGFTSFMTAVVVFFVGLLLTTFSSYDITIKIPIAFLVISIFGFLYATIIFTNAAGEVVAERWSRAQHYMIIADVLSEYMGVYFLVLAIPLVVNVITSDLFLRTVTVLSCLIGLAIYQFSNVSFLNKHFGTRHRPISIFVLLTGIALFTSQLFHFYFIFTALVFIVTMLTIALVVARRGRPTFT